MIGPEDNDQLQIPTELPVLPVRDLVVFPDMIAPLFVSRPTSVAAVEQAVEGQRMLLLVAQREGGVEAPGLDELHSTGTVGIAVRMRRLEDGRLKLLIQGIRKARIESLAQELPFLVAHLRPILDLPLDEISTETEALMRSLRTQLKAYARSQGSPGPDVLAALEGIADPGRLADLVASHIGLGVPEAQEVLETPDPVRRLRTVIEHLARETELLSAQAHIERRVKEGLDKTQREYYLREQIKQIRTELGEAAEDDLEELEQRLHDSAMPDEVRAEAAKQLKRLGRMHPESAEAGTLRSYVEHLLELPWGTFSQDRLDLAHAKEVLDEDHLGLGEVKDRVIEHLAVRKLNPNQPAPVLCLIGPPGVGKTSLGRSVARALGRGFVRISLGGVRDEGEIRGHRRTYVGAMPGRIAQAIDQARTFNPVLALDEIDKLGRDMRGDPAAALLEVLDPEQNGAFIDHYLNVPIDLSQVLFLTTGNRIDTIPPPLLDRMELIQVPGYALDEKVAIAQRHLVPRQRERCGLTQEQFDLAPHALELVVERYTRESGLRQLEQTIAALGRKIARKVAEGEDGPGRLGSEQVRGMLGPQRHQPLEAVETDAVGIVNGLAWTPAGGEVLQVEAAAAAGRGQLILTGQLGEVMKESAQAALSFTRSLDARQDSSQGPFAGQDIHIHIPAGAIPKDGPSAGIAMVVALVSLLTRIPVRCRLAMTGEISLRGRILAVGGLREKLLAAIRAGLKQVIVPSRNRDDLEALPSHLLERIEILQADNVEQALDWALVTTPFAKDSRPDRSPPTGPKRPDARLPAGGGSA